MRNIIFTAIFDNYDKLNEVTLPSGWRAICFSNTPIESATWEIVHVEKYDKVYRDIKIRPHVWLPDHKMSVWIDGNLEIMIPLDKFVEGKDEYGFWLMKHPDRNCIYKEAERCIELGKDDAKLIRAQMEWYVSRRYPRENGLGATGCIIRSNELRISEFNEEWWGEVKRWSVRDQLSFDLVCYNRCFLNTVQTFPFLENIKYHYHVERQRKIDERERNRATRKRKNGRITDAYRKLYGK